ncbi:response regulator transcription factor [Paraliomyxa miuraensis]|uniref:response regulator transcription factor n=1 Tax=Paraliomyxa miuraensis TaxID=376150 RepID=UPI0022510882|nr:response regulator [Paraliomyxa miuraensis]MCX4245851.1 response regulator [Paraliomyxa miuraensis]
MPTKILAIDDSKTMRLAIKITFAAEDADVTSVSKGSDAVARAKQLGADVVLVDANLAAGEPSGYDVCRALKSDPATSGIPVLMLVSNQAPVDEAKIAAVGGDGWISKPFDSQELIDKVAAVKGKAPAKVSVAAAEPAASQSGTSKRVRPNNRTQMGMPSPTPPPTTAATTPAAPARTPRQPAPAPTPAPTPAVAAPPQRAPRQPAAAAATPTPRTATPPARSAAPAAAMTSSAAPGSIPIAIPIPFTAADSPTPGMVARIQAAASSGGVDPRVAEAIASLSREVIERIVWEVVPDLAESIIREQQSA